MQLCGDQGRYYVVLAVLGRCQVQTRLQEHNAPLCRDFLFSRIFSYPAGILLRLPRRQHVGLEFDEVPHIYRLAEDDLSNLLCTHGRAN